MRTLFYLHPAVLPGGPEFNSGWTKLFVDMLSTLESTFPGDNLLVTGSRFGSIAQEAGVGDRVRLLSEHDLLAKVRSASPAAAVPGVFARLARTEKSAAHPALAILAGETRRACSDFQPDLIVSFSMPCFFLRDVWPDAVCMTAEAGAFSRSPFPFSLFFDHQGMYRESGAARYRLEHYRAADREEMLSVAREFRERSGALLQAQDPFSSFGFRHRYERLVLLPLQVSGWYSFDEQAPYGTQFEYLHDALSGLPEEIGVLVSEYIQWGPVLLDEGSNRNLQYLRDRFPNLIFHRRFRQYASPSQYLVHHVDGVWTQSSNLGYQALLWGKRLGTTSQTHLRNVAHDLSLRSFARNVLSGEKPGDHEEYLAWYLQHYAVPQPLLRDPALLRDYLQRRVAAARTEAQPSPASFVPVAPAGAMKDAWMGAFAREPGGAERWHVPSSRALARFAQSEAALARAQALTLAIRSQPAKPRAPRYILLNDTRSIDGMLHLGCNIVTEHIHQRMRSLGLTLHGSANTGDECRALMEDPLFPDVCVVVLNGEGSVHHDSQRMVELFDFCGAMRNRGVPCVLINSVWHENTSVLGSRLGCFELVAVRESISLEAARMWRTDARVVPDLSFAAFRAATAGFDVSPAAWPPSRYAVIDSVYRDRTEALVDFADFHEVPMYLMGRLHADLLLNSVHWSQHLHGEGIFPRILKSSTELGSAQACVTGRFHGLAAGLVAGVPTVALGSNTPKIEGVLGDIGISEASLLDEDWCRMSNPERAEAVERLIDRWNTRTRAAVVSYIDKAVSEVDDLFRSIGQMLGRQQLDASWQPGAISK